MPVNWNLGLAPDIIGTAMNAFEQGKQMRREEASRNAMAAILRPTPAGQTPGIGDGVGANRPDPYSQLTPQDMATVQQFQQRQSQIDQRQQEQADAERKRALEQVQIMGKLLSDVTDEASYQRGLSAAQQLGLDTSKAPSTYNPDWVQQLKFIVTKTLQDAQFTLAPGSKRFDEAGNLIAEAPFAPHYSTVSEGQTIVRDQPGGSGPVSADMLLPHIKTQESGGNYAAINRESGALGAYQVMPATGQSLAQRLGLPWRPDLMTSNTPEGKQYQDQIGQAAVQEAVQASGGDPVKAAMYYHGGSDQSKWGPRTQRYGQEVAARLGSGATVVAKGPPKQEKQWQTLTPQEVQAMGLPAGVYQRGPGGEIKPVAGTVGKPGQNDPGYSQSAIDSFNRAILSARELYDPFTGKTHPGFSAGVGVPSINPFDGNLAGRIVPGSPAADFRTQLDTLKSQVFLPMVQSMKGMGALSNAEGEKLTAAIGNLSPNQSEGQFKKSITQIIKDLETYRNRANKPPAPAPQARSAGPRPTVSNW